MGSPHVRVLLQLAAGSRRIDPMTSVEALVRMATTALRGGLAVGLDNNNRNNASLPRAGD